MIKKDRLTIEIYTAGYDNLFFVCFLGDQTIITAGSDNQVVSHIFKAED